MDAPRRRNFNPRSRVGNDLLRSVRTETGMDFNPRSRVGNDELSPEVMRMVRDFNPRSRVGNDSKINLQNIPSKEFQSTFPRGERL